MYEPVKLVYDLDTCVWCVEGTKMTEKEFNSYPWKISGRVVTKEEYTAYTNSIND